MEKVARVCRTVPDEFRICTVMVSNAVVVLVSAVSMCSQKLRVAAVAFAGMVTCCIMVSVVVVPKPSIQASKVPECGGSVAELAMISCGLWVEVSTQGAGVVLPFSKPGLPRICVVVPPAAVMVNAIVAVWVMPPPVAVTVTLVVPVVAVLLTEKVRVELPFPGAAMLPGLKLAVTPEGRPEADNEIAELKPPLTEVEIVLVPEPPWATDRLVGEALRLKLGVAAAVMVSAIVTA